MHITKTAAVPVSVRRLAERRHDRIVAMDARTNNLYVP